VHHFLEQNKSLSESFLTEALFHSGFSQPLLTPEISPRPARGKLFAAAAA